MEIPTIKPQDISTYQVLVSEFKALQEKASNEIVAARLNGENDITISRDGQPVTIKEKNLWTEVFALGPDSDAGQILKNVYPAAFELSAEANKKSEEMKKFAIASFGVNPLEMSLSDIFRIIEAVFEMKKHELRD